MKFVIPIYPKKDGFVWFYHTYRQVVDNVTRKHQKSKDKNKQKEVMQSKLNISDFKNKLKNSTKIGHPQLKFFTPFSLFFFDSSKPFYGLYDDSTFSLTSNLKVTQTLYIVRGNYKNVNGELQIQYKIFPRFKYQYHFWMLWVVCFFVLLIFINIKMLNNSKESDLLAINSLSILMLCYGFFMSFIGKRNLKKKIIQVFEIYSSCRERLARDNSKV